MPAQVLRANPAVVSATFVDTAGATVDPGVVSVTVTNLAGTEVDSGTASGSGATARTYTLDVDATATLDTLTVTFDPATAGLPTIAETVEVVGAFLFTEVEARAHNGGVLSSESAYSDARIQAARASITDEFERICNVSFVPRYRLDYFDGLGLNTLSLDRFKVTAIRSVEVRTHGTATWVAYEADDLADVFRTPSGGIFRESRGIFTSGYQNIRIGYEYGFTHPPYEIREAALMALELYLKKSQVDPRAISISDEMTTTQLWTPGLSARGTAIHPHPEVDRRLKLFNFNTPVIA